MQETHEMQVPSLGRSGRFPWRRKWQPTPVFSSVQFSHSVISDSAIPWTAARQASLSIILLEFTQTYVHWVGDAIQPSHPLSSPSPPAFSLSQNQGLSNESVLHIRCPKYWSFSFSISPLVTKVTFGGTSVLMHGICHFLFCLCKDKSEIGDWKK